MSKECQSCGTVTDKDRCPICEVSKYLVEVPEDNDTEEFTII